MLGHLALILHAHLPFVRHPEHEHFLEEDWFFEAMTESYIPLLRMMQRLVDDHVPFKLTMSLTPTLCAMLQDELLCQRYVRHLDLLIDLAARERKRNRNHPQLRDLADFYFKIFRETRRFFVDEYKCDLLASFRELRETDVLEIIGSAATHGLLPLLQEPVVAKGADLGAPVFYASAPRSTPAATAARAQILIGRDVYVDLFGAEPVSMLTACYLEHRGRAVRFTHLVIRRPGRPLLRATAIPAGRFGAHREVILATLLTVNFIATLDSTFHGNTWDPLAMAPGNFPA